MSCISPWSAHNVLGRLSSLVPLVLVLALSGLLLSCGDNPGPEPKPDPDPDPDPEVIYFGPEIHVTSPERSAMFKMGDDGLTTVDIAGSLCDSHRTLLSFEFDGHALGLSDDSPCQSFATTKDSPCGLTILKGKLFNDLGQFGWLSQSFLRSPTFYPVATVADPTARVATATVAQVGQELLDDGDRADYDDLASIIQYAVTELDVVNMIADPMIRDFYNLDDLTPLPLYYADPDANGDGEVDRKTYNCGFWDETNYKTGFKIALTNILHDGIEVRSLTFIEDGIRAVVRVLRPRIEGSVTWHLDLACLGEDDDTTGLAVAVTQYVEMTLDAFPSIDQDGQLVCSFDVVDIDYVNLDIDVGGLPSLFDEVDDLIRDLVIDLFVDAVELVFKDMAMDQVSKELTKVLDKKVQEFLAGFLPGGDIGDFPPPLDQLVVCFEASLDQIQFEPTLSPQQPGYVRLGAFVQVFPKVPDAEHLDKPYGSLQYTNTVPDLTGDGLYGLGLRDDLLNQFLWAVWLAGGLDLPDIPELLAEPLEGLAGLSLTGGSVFATLPPVIMLDASGNGMEVAIGDLCLDFEMTMAGTPDPLHIVGYVSARLGGEFSIDALTNTLECGFDPENFVDISMQFTEFECFDLELRDPLNSMLQAEMQLRLPEILAGILSRYPLPEIPIGDFTIPGLEEGAQPFPSLDLAIIGGTLERQQHYTVLTGTVHNTNPE